MARFLNGLVDRLIGRSLEPLVTLTHQLGERLSTIGRTLETIRSEVEAGRGETVSKIAPLIGNARKELEDAVASAIADERRIIDTQLANVREELRAMVALVQQTGGATADSRLGIEKVATEFPNLIGHLETSVHSRLNTLENGYLVGIQNKLQELSDSGGVAMHGMRAASEGRLLMEKLAVELPSAFSHLDSGLNSRMNNLDNLAMELSNRIAHLDTALNSRMNTLENEHFPEMVQQIHEIAAVALSARAAQQDHAKQWVSSSNERYEPAAANSFQANLDRAQREFPKTYPEWRRRLDAMESAFDQTKVGNAAHGGDVYSRLFRSFVEIHAAGRVLDIGCGVFGRPYYLQSYPAHLISALDPLVAKEPADFELVRGISEFLPWPTGSFSTVVSATSLDHCLSLERSVCEKIRVLAPGGKILLWIGSVPGAPKFDWDGADFPAADQFHLFHFDAAWFDPMLEQRFEIADRLEFPRPGYSHVFYSLRPRPGLPEPKAQG